MAAAWAPLAILDRAGNFVFVNDAFARLVGKDAAEITGNSLNAFCSSGDFAAARTCREHPYEYEIALACGDGEKRPTRVTASPLCAADGSPVGTLAMFADLSERRRAEEELRESEEKFRQINAAAQDAIIMMDRDGRISHWNDAATRIFGYSADEVLGKDLHELIAARKYEHKYKEGLRLFRASGEGAVLGKTLELTAVTKDGQEFPAELAVSAVTVKGETHALAILRDATERKRAEEELRRARDQLEERVRERTAELAGTLNKLRESEEMYKTLVRTSPDAITMTDLDGKIIFASERVAELCGFASAEEIVGLNSFDLIAPEDREKAAAATAQTLTTGVIEGVEYTLLRKDGSRFVGESSASVIRDADGRPKALIGTTRDITEQKRAQAALRESEEKYRGVVEQLQDGVVIIQDGALVFCNAKFATTVGYAPEELRGRPFADFLAPRVRDSVLARYRKRLMGEEAPAVYESVGLAHDGREIPVEFNVTVIQYDGRPAELVIIRDLTERRAQEEVLRRQRWILENIFNDMPDWVYVVDPDNRDILFVNKTAEEAFGPGLVGAKCYRAIWGLDRPCRACTLEKMFTTDDNATYSRESFNEKLGRWLGVNSKAVPWFDGRAVRCSVLTDISERKALEEEIVAHNKALHNTVRERTAALEAKNRELESFAYSISHDLRAPLRSIEGFSRALLEDYADDLDESGRDFLTRVVNGAARMDRLINDLLEYSRLGRRGVTFEPVDMNELVATSLEDLRSDLEAAGGSVAVAEPLPTVIGDPSLLLVLWHNLLGNAIKYRRADVPLKIEVGAREDGGKYIFSVKDNGIGLDMKYQDKVFEIFQRLHGGDEYTGTGIGLASARKVVAAHRGRIWYESEPGLGATFFFELGPPLTATAEKKG